MDLKKTEFWIALVGMLGSMATAIIGTGLISDQSILGGIIGLVAVTCTYIGGRSWAKAAAANSATAPATPYHALESATAITSLPVPAAPVTKP
jgi:hypothetical protein